MSEYSKEKEIFSLIKDGEVAYRQSKDMTVPPKNLFSLLVNRIKKTFQLSTIEEETKLSGRVQQLNQTAVSVMQKLKEVKELLKGELDPHLFTYVETLMDPMTRDIVCVQNLLTEKGSVVHQAKAFKKYSNWMSKAELWMELESKVNDTEAIIKTIILHIMHEADEQIDQDLQVIRDYEDHVLDALPLNDEEAGLLKKHLDKEMRTQMACLEDLKDKPEISTLHQVFNWKDDVDKKRSKCFDRALQIIDEMIHAISPSSTSEEEHDYLVEVLTQIAYLEEEIPSLLLEIDGFSPKDAVRKNLLLSKVHSFGQEVHKLNLNLRLTPELVDRLQILLDKLDSAEKKIS